MSHMPREQYALAHFMLHEFLIDIDLAGLQIGQCGGRCRGHAEEDVMKLCPACWNSYRSKLELIEHFTPPAEFDALLRTMREASRNDKTGELELIIITAGYTAAQVH
jgi:hypothetical protein